MAAGEWRKAAVNNPLSRLTKSILDGQREQDLGGSSHDPLPSSAPLRRSLHVLTLIHSNPQLVDEHAQMRRARTVLRFDRCGWKIELRLEDHSATWVAAGLDKNFFAAHEAVLPTALVDEVTASLPRLANPTARCPNNRQTAGAQLVDAAPGRSWCSLSTEIRRRAGCTSCIRGHLWAAHARASGGCAIRRARRA